LRPPPRYLLGSLRARLIGSMTLLLCGGLGLVSALHALEEDGRDLGEMGRLLLGDELPEPWQDLAVLLPFSLIMLVLIGVVTTWSLRPLLRASQEAALAGPQNPSARIGTAHLPSELSSLVEAVNDALDRLTAAYETERRFTIDAAHELRTPLAALSLRLQRIRRGDVTPDWPALDADIAAMRCLIEGLLDLARKEAVAAGLVPVNLSRVIREVAAGLEPLVQEAGRVLQVDLPDRVQIQGNPGNLHDMIRNLVQNALVHGRGRIGIRLRLVAGRVALLDVSDEGPGPEPDQRETLFERFRKGNQSGSGSGLGLAIVRAVVTTHGGTVRFIDQPRCTLQVSLPAM